MATVTAEPWDLGDRITVYYHLGKHGGIYAFKCERA